MPATFLSPIITSFGHFKRHCSLVSSAIASATASADAWGMSVK
jgi:hypothetical protein